MSPKQLLEQWVITFNQANPEALAAFYHEDAINHQVPLGIKKGKAEILKAFREEFGNYEMVCIVENIFQDGDVGILEWKDPKGLRGCGFFWFREGKIIYQRGYWDRGLKEFHCLARRGSSSYVIISTER